MRDQRKYEQTNQPSGQSLESRVRELERKLMRLRRIGLVGLVIAIVVTMSGQATTNSDVLKTNVLEAREIHIVDEDGMQRILLHVDDRGRANVLLKCRDNKALNLEWRERPFASLIADHEGSRLNLFHPTGGVMTMAKENMKGIEAKMKGLEATARLTVNHADQANLSLLGRSGRQNRSMLQATSYSVQLTDAVTKTRKELHLDKD